MFKLKSVPVTGRAVRVSPRAAALIGAAVLLLGGAQRLDGPVEVDELRVRDGHGTVRMIMGPLPDGGTAISLRDARGTPEIIAMIRPDGSKSLALYSDGGAKGLLTMGLGREGAATVALGSAVAPAGAVLRTLPSGASSLEFRDLKGKIRLSLGLEPDGTPSVQLFDQNGKRTSAVPGL